jgi:hypothetical protein
MEVEEYCFSTALSVNSDLRKQFRHYFLLLSRETSSNAYSDDLRIQRENNKSLMKKE